MIPDPQDAHYSQQHVPGNSEIASIFFVAPASPIFPVSSPVPEEGPPVQPNPSRAVGDHTAEGKETKPADTLTLDFEPQNHEKISLFTPPRVWCFVMGALAN